MNHKMTINTYLLTIGSKKQNEQAEQKQTQRYGELFDSCQMGGVGGMDEKGEGIKKYKLVVTE